MNIEIKDLKKVNLKPGEVLVVTVPGDTLWTQKARIKEQMKEFFPDNKIMIIDEGISLDVAGDEED